MGRVVVFGSLNIDRTVRVRRLPSPGETVLGGEPESGFGGKGANQAVAAALAGGEVALVGRVGADAAGEAYADRLERFEIDLSGLTWDPQAPTGSALILVDDRGENSIVVSPGANARADASALRLGPEDVLLMQLEVPHAAVCAAVAVAADAGARVVLNLAPFAELPAEVLAYADPVVVNRSEAELLTAAGARPPSLLTTLGAKGSRWGELTVPAEPADSSGPVEVVDTTGAGDAYCGALASALAAGAGREEAMRSASRAAAAAVGRVGAQPEPPEPV